jgi:lipid A 4'-phosphatase
MSYLRLPRACVMLASFLIVSLVLVKFPAIDIRISSLFFNGQFYSQQLWWEQAFHRGVSIFICVSVLSILGVYAFNRITKRKLLAIDGKKVVYLLVVLGLGAGLLVNVICKDNFGRARPRDVQEFGGQKHFTPAFVVASECTSNCSFASGETAAAFFSLALVMALARRRRMFVASVVFGVAVSISRMAVGAHFFSDTVVSFFVMLILSDVLYHYMLAPQQESEFVRKLALASPGRI